MTTLALSDTTELVDFEEIEQTIDALVNEHCDMLENGEYDFVEKLEKRVSDFGAEAYISKKQYNWLMQLKRKYIK